MAIKVNECHVIDGKPIQRRESRKYDYTIVRSGYVLALCTDIMYRHVYTHTPKYSISNNSLHNYKSILFEAAPHPPPLLSNKVSTPALDFLYYKFTRSRVIPVEETRLTWRYFAIVIRLNISKGVYI